MADALMTKQLNGAQILMNSLRRHNVDSVFGYPGAIILSIYEEFYNCNDIKHYLVRHEQAAVHAAEGYARVSGKCGVVLVTSGPGATNTITGIANAFLDCYPLVVLCGQVPSGLIGNDAFQEVNIVEMTKTCSKWGYQVKTTDELDEVLEKAFNIATTGRQGPVVIDLPKDVLENKIEFTEIFNKKNQTEKNSNQTKTPNNDYKKIAEILKSAKKPVILAGGGVLTSNSSNELTSLAKKINSPVALTMMAAGAYELTDETNLGMPGVLGNYWTNQAISECDVLLAIGTRITDRINNPIKNCAKNGATIIYIDIEPSPFLKLFPQAHCIIEDAKVFLQNILLEIENINFDLKTDWIEKISSWKSKKTIPLVPSEKLYSHKVLEKIYECTKDYNPIVATEVGQHQLWAIQMFEFNQPRKFLTSGGLGTMGFGFPAAMGACLADKNSLVLNIAGDGSIQMNIQELATCVEYNLPVKVIILNNGYLGMVRQWQEKLFDKHYCGTEITSPDFVKVAEAYGAKGIRVKKEEDITKAMQDAIEYNGPVFIEFITEPFEFVHPYIAK